MSDTSSESSIEVRVIRTRRPPNEVNIQGELEDANSSISSGSVSTARPRSVLHFTVRPGGPIVFGTSVEVQVVRNTYQRVKVHSERGVRRETLKDEKGYEVYSKLWRKDSGVLKFQLELRDDIPLHTLEWRQSTLKRLKVD